MIEDIPMWGSLSIVGVLIGIILFILALYFRGELVSRKQLEQVQKIADSYQKAWEISESTKEEGTQVLNKLLVGQETMLRILESSPPYKSKDES